MAGTLYVVGTPIGNLGDFSPRAVEVLSSVDFIAAEDTRVTIKLLNHFGIKKPMVSYYEHNRTERGAMLIERMLNGESCALVSDAGMPIISDPGEDLTLRCHENGIQVCAVPGPSAFVTALAISGMPSGRFTFEGFLSVSKPSRRKHLEELVNEKRTMIFHEAPHKLKATVSDMAEIFGEDRKAAFCRELTKLNEQILRVTLGEAKEYYSKNEPRGEFVVVVEGAPSEKESDLFWSEMTIPEHVIFYINSGMSKNDAIKAAAKDRKLSKNDVYSQVLDIKV
jgi:16S rRNA (cytidine1402-2'-O)-methyltransferase